MSLLFDYETTDLERFYNLRIGDFLRKLWYWVVENTKIVRFYRSNEGVTLET